MDDLRYPVGKLQIPAEITPEIRQQWIGVMAETPARLRLAVAGLSDQQLDTPYRNGGWTVRQVVHHLPDSHLNSYIRFKWALTENNPTIKAYDEQGWAMLPDSKGPIEPSLEMLEALHRRWVSLLSAMSEADFARSLVHPESGPTNLNRLLAVYAWHGPHHVAHITELRKRMNW